MKLLPLILLFLVPQSFAAPKWTPIVELKNSDIVFFVDENSFSGGGGIPVEATIKVSPKEEYVLQKWSVDCKAEEVSILSIQQFKGDGTLVKIIPGPMKVTPIPVGSAVKHIVNKLCSRSEI